MKRRSVSAAWCAVPGSPSYVVATIVRLVLLLVHRLAGTTTKEKVDENASRNAPCLIPEVTSHITPRHRRGLMTKRGVVVDCRRSGLLLRMIKKHSNPHQTEGKCEERIGGGATA